MTKVSPSPPLTETELDRLEDFLYRANPDKAMTLEELDGFFCALICGPEVVLPSEYLPYVFGGDQVGGLKSIEEAREITALLMRHWNNIAQTLLRGEAYPVLLGTDEGGVATGHAWAVGFEQGIYLRQDGWNKLVDDRKFNAALLPIISLAEEAASPDSSRLTAEEREETLGYLAPSVLVIYRYFREPKRARSQSHKKKRPRSEGRGRADSPRSD
jgi:uncharacterized protein